jgi:hypothetical protein
MVVGDLVGRADAVERGSNARSGRDVLEKQSSRGTELQA